LCCAQPGKLQPAGTDHADWRELLGVESLVLYIWTDTYNNAAVSTENREFANKLKEWAESEGYRVTFSNSYKTDARPNDK
jgi:hypothetical protein